MLKIRRAQMLQMLEADPALLRSAITQRVQEHYAEVVKGLPRDLLEQMIDNGIRAARGYGLTQGQDIAGFVLVMFEVGPEFHRHPQIRKILRDPTIASEQKLTAVFNRTPDQVWEEIVAVLHRQTWFPELREPDTE